MPWATACVVSVAMTSSASKPSTPTHGMRSAASTSWIRLTWPLKSLGDSDRPAL